ncbi:MAG: efflux RND transporter periplasmic adaptor subunit [Phycisphaerales bacterium JB054]
MPSPQSPDQPPRRSRLAIILPVAVLLATVGIAAWSAWPTFRPVPTVSVAQAVFDRSSLASEATEQATPDTQPAAGRGVTVQAPGWLEADPYFVAATALADGIVETVDVLEGDTVTKGQPVAHLVAEDSELRLADAAAALQAAIANVASAQADLAAAQTDWDEPVERERAVATMKAALAEAEAELAQLPSRTEAASAILAQLQEEYDRVEQSVARGAASDIEAFTLRQRVASQRATVNSLLATQPILEARVDRFAAELQAAERNLQLRTEERRRLDAMKAAAASAEAALSRARVARDEAKLELDRMVVRAPIDGIVQRRFKVPGDKVMLGMDSPHSSHIAHLYDPAKLQVRVDVPLADAAHLFVGQRCEVIVEVLPDTTFAGEVTIVTHEADLQKNTLQAKVRVIDPSPLLRPEMLTRVKFLPRNASAARPDTPSAPGASASTRVLVPEHAVLQHAGTPHVITVRNRQGDRGRTARTPVEVLSAADGWATILAAIQPGDLLVLDAGDLADGTAVRFTAATTEGQS